jgi:DNA-binding NarL/FixJ family response regulator
MPDPDSNTAPMIRVAVLAADATLRHRLEQQVAGTAGLTLAGVLGDADALARQFDRERIDLVLGDLTPAAAGLGDHPHTIFVALLEPADPEHALDALHSGAAAILPRSAEAPEIAAAIDAAMRGLSVVPTALLRALLAPAGAAPDRGGAPGPELTQRELGVLAALADGASNKAIARRLGISFHTVKFHVASILAKLDAESRTEAVAQAARRGLVML